MKVAPSILTMNFLEAGRELSMLQEEGVEVLHLDVMDGNFVPNLSFGPAIIKQFSKIFHGLMEAHLMIDEPEKSVDSYMDAGCKRIIISQESTIHTHRLLQYIRSQGCEAGMALNPGTELSVIEPLYDELDLVLIMTVNPGFGGQKFIEATRRKIQAFLEMRKAKSGGPLLEIDGGVKANNFQELAAMGIDLAVVGSGIFKEGTDSKENLQAFL